MLMTLTFQVTFSNYYILKKSLIILKIEYPDNLISTIQSIKYFFENIKFFNFDYNI